MATDEKLIEQIKEGKTEAYGQLFREYYQQIYAICFSVLKNQHDAEEVTQETFVQAYLKLDQLKKPDRFFAWLKKIARNRSKNYLRDKREDTISLSLASAQTVDDGITPVQTGVASVQDGVVPLTQIAPDEHLLRQELIDSIMEAVEALPTKDREVVRARMDGLDHSEISERLSISAQASMNRLHRARKKISAHLKDLLNAIFGLPKLLPLKKVILGGILAMKIGTTAKVTIGVIGILVAGFIGFQAVKHQSDVGLTTTEAFIAREESSSLEHAGQAALVEGTELTDDIQVNEERVLVLLEELEDEELEALARESFLVETQIEKDVQQQENVSTAQVDPEEAYYSQFDKEMGNLDMIGIHVLVENSPNARIFKPTETDRQRLEEIEKEMKDALDQGLVSLEPQERHIAVDLGEDNEIVYVRPDYLEHFQNLWKDYQEVHKHSMRPPLPSEAQTYSGTVSTGKSFPDGTELEYYRRKDGSLMRSIRKPDGTVRKWVIGWADLSRIPPQLRGGWRDE